MATYNRPGVYVEEIATTNPIVSNGAGTVAAFLGAATKGPVVPTVVSSWSQYTSLYGSWDATNAANNTLTQAVSLFFANGGNNAYIQRVLNTTTATVSGAVGFTAITTTATSNTATVVLTTAPSVVAGQTVTGPGIPANTKVSSWTSGSKTLVLTQSASIPAASTLTFGSTAVTLAASNSALSSTTANYPVTGSGIPAGTTATVNGTSVVLSQAVTALADATVLTFTTTTSAFAILNDQAGSPAPTLGLTAKTPGSWGNSLSYAVIASTQGSADLFTLAVYYNGTTDAYKVETFTDITMNPSSSSYAVAVINATSNYITASDKNSANAYSSTDNPAAVAVSGSTALSTGSDGYTAALPIPSTVVAAKVSAFDAVTIPLVLNAPGITTATDVNTLLAYASNRQDIFVVIDAQLTPSDVTSQLNLANTYTASGYGAVYYPNLVVPNPQSSVPGATVTAYNGGAIVAKYVTTDASRGVFKSPAGMDVRLAGVVATNTLSNTDLDNLNTGNAVGSSGTIFTPVNAIRYISGSGFVVMGARTLKTDYSNKYISVRRSIIYLRKNLTDLTSFAIFEPNDQRLWNRVKTTVESSLISFWQQGGLKGVTPSDAFYVKCDGTNNSSQTIANGQVIVEVGVALQRPAEFVVIRISQYDSGSVVTVL